jgi:3-hydroxyphenylacetate 6-hydroxylase
MHGHATWVSRHSYTLDAVSTFPVQYTDNTTADSKIWTDPEVFRPERFLEKPDAPLFTYGLGYRMCAGSILANRELYLIFMRLLNSFFIEQADNVDIHPVRGNADPTSLVAMPKKYEVKFVPRSEKVLREALAIEAEKHGD